MQSPITNLDFSSSNNLYQVDSKSQNDEFLNSEKAQIDAMTNIPRVNEFALKLMISSYMTETKNFISYLSLNNFNQFLTNQAMILDDYMRIKNAKYKNAKNSSKINHLQSLPLREDTCKQPKGELFKLVKPIVNKKDLPKRKFSATPLPKKYWSIEQDYAIFYIYLYHNSKYWMLKPYIKDKTVCQMRSRFYNQLRTVKIGAKIFPDEDTNMRKILTTFGRLTKELMVSRNYSTKEELVNFIEKEVGIVNCKSHEIFNKIDGIAIISEVRNLISQNK